MDSRKPKTCLGCSLAELGKGFLHSEGSGRNGVLILGESAGHNEASSGLPFRPTAAAGGLLERWFKTSRLKRDDFTIFNVTNCQPPDNNLAPFETTAVSHCKQYVDAVVERAQPRVILALGKASFKAATGITSDSIMEQRGYVHNSVWGVPCIGSYHPAFLLRGAMHLMGVSLHDLRTAVKFAHDGVPAPLLTHYNLTPSIADCQAYLQRLHVDPALVVSYDIETASILRTPEPESWAKKRIIQIQFSSAAGEALVLPWDDIYLPWIKAVLATPNPKLTWNGRLSDDVALRSHGVPIGGESYDAMTQWSHMQPGFAGRDAGDDEDKGVPARLLNLQAAVSFYFPHEGCWKGTVKAPGPGLGSWYALQANLRYYGCLWKESRVMLWGGGSRQIRFIVNNQESPLVVGMDEESNMIPVRVIGWRRVNVPKQEWLSIKADCVRQPMYLTPDHRVWTNHGWVAAEKLKIGDLIRIPRAGQSDLIHGTLLGDSCVDARGRLRFTHCAAQKGWFDVKRKALNGPTYRIKNKDHWSTEVWVSPQLWHRAFYTPYKRFIAPPSDAALAVWYCDDGCLAGKTTPRIAVYGFPNMADVVDYFEREFGMGNVSFYNDSRSNGGAFAFIKQATNLFFTRVAPFVHPSMEYKLPERFRGRYSGWLEDVSQHAQWAVVEHVKPKTFSYRGGTSRYCITVDHPTHRFFTMGGLVENCRDADLTWRIGTRLMDTLKRQGLWDGWYRYKHQLGIALSRMSERGLPIDRTAQNELREHIEEQEQRLDSELQHMVPAHLRPANRKDGYKSLPKDLRAALKAVNLLVPKAKLDYYYTNHYDLCNQLGYFVRDIDGEFGLVKVLPFNPRSNKQILAYIRWQVEQEAALVPSLRERRWFIPLHIDTKRPTTNKAGVEALLDATNDPALRQIETCKKISKLKDYCSGKWEPDEDGCVHAEFRVGITGTGQTTATNPPIQTYPKHFSKSDEWLAQIGKRIKSIIAAPPGHIMVETDMRGFHARMQAFLAEDAAYYRLANIDTHSFLAAHYVGVPDKDTLLELDDDKLSKRLGEIKQQYDYERNYLCKRVSFLNQYGGQAAKASSILRLPQVEVQFILDISKRVFKPAFEDLPKRIEAMLRRNPRLVTAFGFPRYFWDADLNQAIAFWVASPAHCVIQDAVLRLGERGALERFNAVNLMHDAVWWCPREEDADECIAVAHEEFERASTVLVNSLGAFNCSADAKKGYNMASLEDA